MDPIGPDPPGSFAEVLCYNEHEPVEAVKVGDLSMVTYHITIDYTDEAVIPQLPDSSPERRRAAAWRPCDRGSFRVHVAVPDVKPQQPDHDLDLSGSQADQLAQAVSDLAVALENVVRGQRPRTS